MSESKFRKGDKVVFRFGVRDVEGAVKEDRGPIGIKGRHLYLVEFRPESHSDDVTLVELPAAMLQSVQHTVSQ